MMLDLLKKVALVLLSLAAVVFSICFLATIYLSTQGVMTNEIEPIEKSLQKVEAVLKENDTPTGMLRKFRSENERLQANLQILRGQANTDSQLRQKVIDDLSNVILSLTTLQTQWSNERYENQSALSESLFKLKALRERLEPTSTPAKVVGLALTQLGVYLTGFGKLAVLLAWPLVVLLIFLYLFRSPKAPQRLSELFSNFKSVEFGGALKLERADKVKASLEETFAGYRGEVKELYDQAIKKKDLNERLEKLMAADSKIMVEINKARATVAADAGPLQNHRCTLHVPDLLLADTFYQLLDYFPRQPGNPETRGRTWSYRFGFIGRTWRTEKSDVQATVSAVNSDELISKWGMTKAEAEDAGKGRQSFLGVLLKQNDVRVALFYMDSTDQNAFGPKDNQALCQLIDEELTQRKITEDLASIKEELSGKAPRISIYSQ